MIEDSNKTVESCNGRTKSNYPFDNKFQFVKRKKSKRNLLNNFNLYFKKMYWFNRCLIKRLDDYYTNIAVNKKSQATNSLVKIILLNSNEIFKIKLHFQQEVVSITLRKADD